VKSFWGKKQNRWFFIALIFGVGPLFFFLVYITPATVRISDFKNRVQVQIARTHVITRIAAGASELELKQLEEVKNHNLSRVKKIDSRASLLRFSGILADGLASQARAYGLSVLEVDFQNTLIKGGYQPENEHALDALNKLPSIEWEDMADPLDLPMLKLPSIEIQMTLGPGYSEVLSFIESLSDFPAQVNLVALATTDESHGRGFRLKIRGYYFGAIEKPGPS
jgi:hypothetical protein